MIQVQNLTPNRDITVVDASDTQKVVTFRTTIPFVLEELVDAFIMSEVEAVVASFEGYELIVDDRNRIEPVEYKEGERVGFPMVDITMVIEKGL